MRTLLIVDDEIAIRNSVRIMVERADTQFKHIYECSNGLEALNWLKENKADLILVDMRMPVMDGLELLKNVAEFSKQPKCVILSGYGEFTYASQCMKYGASVYLLKPIHRNELAEALHKAEKELDIEEQYENRINKADSIYKKYVSDEIISMFKGEGNAHKVKELAAETDLRILLGTYFSGVLKRDDKNWMRIHNEFIDKLKSAIAAQNICADIWSSNSEVIIACSGLDALEFLLSSCGNIGTWGVSNKCSGMDDMHKSYIQAKEAVKYAFFYPSSRLIQYKRLENMEKNPGIQKENIKKIANLLYTDKLQEFKTVVNNTLFPSCFIGKEISYLQDTIRLIDKEIFGNMTNTMPQYYTVMKNEIDSVSDPYSHADIYEYCEKLIKFLLETNQYILSFDDTAQHINGINSAISFIHNNYYKDINMANVSNYICRSYSYFSREFKERTGFNFADYLRNYRIEKAKELLATTQIKVIDISSMVGYQNPKNFATAFRSVCGITPKEYRDNFNLQLLSSKY